MPIVIATIPGPLNKNLNGGANDTLTIANLSGDFITQFGISGQTCTFPVTWDQFNQPGSGAASGVGTQIVTVNDFIFGGGATDPLPNNQIAICTNIDADFATNPTTAVLVSGLIGARATALTAGGISLTGEFSVVDGDLQAVLT